jgi:uncharacterized membrane protein YkvA (DUF1232 family)
MKTTKTLQTRRLSRKAGMFTLLRRPRAMFRFLTDGTAPWFPRLLALFTVVYLISPVDLIPDVIPILGWLDDLGFLSFAITYVASAAARHENARALLTSSQSTEDEALPATMRASR